jgi:hypothetical protein
MISNLEVSLLLGTKAKCMEQWNKQAQPSKRDNLKITFSLYLCSLYLSDDSNNKQVQSDDDDDAPDLMEQTLQIPGNSFLTRMS